VDFAETTEHRDLAALMIRQACWQHDHGQPAGESANMAKYAAAEASIAAVDAAMQMHGGNGFAAEFGLSPYWGATAPSSSPCTSRVPSSA
jgi:alkylation response protein AidB-like acyl-CoA dehydrogenase